MFKITQDHLNNGILTHIDLLQEIPTFVASNQKLFPGLKQPPEVLSTNLWNGEDLVLEKIKSTSKSKIYEFVQKDSGVKIVVLDLSPLLSIREGL